MTYSSDNALPSHGLPGVAPGKTRALPRGGLFALTRLWHIRYRTRCHLEGLPEHLLRDVGIDHAEVLAEVRKPFWRA